ncbi:AAA domain-containing protein [Pectobacterium aroidearum]|uniref:AAA domain-containing protein n=1 Tax=Pectobacterium aroidearum TaxID=1201031 RepID=UPI002A7FC824|nr:AAA domain-containing protein [Pectobacterium aroidearum]MDY4385340.1 AAA domain-containing protein [Pectobacterium aroidearum]
MDERKYLVLTRSKQSEFKNTTKEVIDVSPSGDKMCVTFQNGKSFPYNRKNVRFFANPEAINTEGSIVRFKKESMRKWDEALIFDNQYLVFFNNGYSKAFPIADVEIIPDIAHRKETKHLIDYYRHIADFLKYSSQSANYYYDKKLNHIREDSVLSHYINPPQSLREHYPLPLPLFPFGVNPSQREAVINALTSQISIIQGPPGTGKTQTILNIIANLVCQNKTIAVVSGNNEATKNIYDKLDEKGFSFISASLGNTDFQQEFFAKENNIPDISHWKISERDLVQTRETLAATDTLISELLDLKNEQAKVQELISRLDIESKYFDKYFSTDPINPSQWSFGNNWSTPNLMRFMAEVEHLSKNERLSWPQRFIWLFKYRIYKFKDLKSLSEGLFKGLISEYYQRRKKELLEKKHSIDKKLGQQNFDELLKLYTNRSMAVLKNHIFSTHHHMDRVEFNHRSYKDIFSDFVKRFPVVLSTTDSIINNKGDNELFDYLIVDEASQVNLLTGVLAMACAKNMIVVGDLQQIPHIPDKSLIATQSDIDDNFGIQSNYSYLTESLLSSISKVFDKNAPSTLLKEHYRCHPRIIDFCNQKYYNGQLVVMTHSDTEPFKIFKTAPGHHTCKDPSGKSQINFRELDVIKKEVLETNLTNIDPEKIGIVTPYRAQVNNANHIIDNKGIKIDTAHKFQGREKNIIIYSPTASWADKFNDSPNLINVAVSRAKEQFILVMSADLFKQQGTNIGDLIRHIEYQSMSPTIFESKIVSIFDCLYNEYSPILQDFKRRMINTSLYDSENLMATLLEDILADKIFTSFTYKHNYPLNLLISDFGILTEIEKRFGKNINSHIDFLVFNKLDKLPVLAIEVDGHQTHFLDPKQKQRDQIKDSILFKLGIPLLRFPTKRSGEEEKIRKALKNIITFIPESDTEQHESVF